MFWGGLALAVALPVTAWRLTWPAHWRPGAAGTALAIAFWGIGLFTLILFARLLGLPFGRGLMVGSSLILIVAARFLRKVLRPHSDPFAASLSDPPPRRSSTPHAVQRTCQIVTVVAWGAIFATSIIRPLSGWDNGFRWDYLARHALELGQWNFYPPVTAEDFHEYGWCDAIPPFVPWLNAWFYALSGQILPVLTAIRVGGEAAILLALIHALGRDLGGPEAGWLATAIWAASAMAVWSLQMGQETGWLAIALVGMLWSLRRRQRVLNAGGDFVGYFWIAAAAGFAGLGGLTREYGLAFALLGWGILWFQRRPRREWTAFLAVVGLIVTPWYVLVAWRTGNPLYPLSFGGLLPTNIVHELWQLDVARGMSWSSNTAARSALTIGLGLLLGPWLIGGVAAGLRFGREAWPLIAGILLMSALWLWSIPYTAGGWIYAARVSGPGIALGAILLGSACARTASRSALVAGTTALVALSIDAAARSHFLPSHPELLPWAQTPTMWRQTVLPLLRDHEHEAIDILVPEAHGGGIIVEHPQRFSRLREAGARAIPLWSPEVREIIAPSENPEATLTQLRAAGIRFIWLDVGVMRSHRVVQQNNVLGFLIFHCPPVVSTGNLSLWDLNLREAVGAADRAAAPAPPQSL